jgi:serine/threonine-protein phosphatase 2A activator
MPTAVPIPDSQIPSNLPDLSQKLPRLTPRRRPQTERKPSNPPPATPPLPATPSIAGHEFFRPTRRILSERDHELFLASDTHNLIVSFVFTLADSVRDTTISSVKSSSAAEDPAIIALLAVLDEAEELLKECPPLDTGSRFGNPAFRDFLSKMDGSMSSWHKKIGVTNTDAEEEVSTYLSQSFGNGTRIDYGSGHELNFILWLLCLRQLSILKESTFPALTLLVFPRYLRLMRDIQSTYYLEPAGSHGVWGLDDYQFLPFLFGASQLIDHKHMRPLSIHNQMIVEECSKDYLYLDQIQWVNASKTVQGLRWHSPMLDDISSAKSWAKVEGGMRRMFLAEVLGKLPVAQHFLFGSLLPATEGMSKDAESQIDEEHVGEYEVTVDGMKHIHNANSWGDCCGIKVPSAVGARLEAKKKGEGSELRRLPFD